MFSVIDEWGDKAWLRGMTSGFPITLRMLRVHLYSAQSSNPPFTKLIGMEGAFYTHHISIIHSQQHSTACHKSNAPEWVYKQNLSHVGFSFAHTIGQQQMMYGNLQCQPTRHRRINISANRSISCDQFP